MNSKVENSINPVKDIVIVGAGGLAKDVRWLIDRLNDETKVWNFLGYINEESGKEVIGNDEFLKKYDGQLYVCIAIGNVKIREKLYNQYKENENLVFPNLIDPSAIVSKEINLGIGNIICANSILSVGIAIGNFNIVNVACTIGHEVQMKNFVIVNPGTNISGNVSIGNSVEIGTGTQIIQGKNIGNSVILGAGTVVIRDIADGCTIVGVPGKVIKQSK